MGGGMARAGTAKLARQELLLQIRVLMCLDGAETRRERVAAQARVDVERTVVFDGQAVPTSRGADHVHCTRHLGIDAAPDAVAAMAGEARMIVRNEAAPVMDRGE